MMGFLWRWIGPFLCFVAYTLIVWTLGAMRGYSDGRKGD